MEVIIFFTDFVPLPSFSLTGTIVIANYDIKNVIFNPPATIVFWADGTKTVVKAHGEEFDPEKGLAMAISKKALGTGYYPEIKKWTKGYEEKFEDDSIEDGSNSSVDIFDLARTYVRKKYGGD